MGAAIDRDGVSFVVPAYNCATTVKATVDSILDQRLPTFEVVIVDDASTDETPRVLADLARRHSDVVMLARNRRNLGGGATRNRAVDLARGELLYMVDADNVLESGLVLRLLEVVRDRGKDAASAEELRFFEHDPSNVSHSWKLEHRDGISGIAELFSSPQVPAAHGNYLFTRSLFLAAGGYDESRGAMDAWTFGMKHIVRGYDVAVALGTWYFHRVGLDSYWLREERLGNNDRAAIAALRENRHLLPEYLQSMISALRPADPFFRLLSEGAFRPRNGRTQGSSTSGRLA